MNPRFLALMGLVLVGGFIVVATRSFSAGTASDLALAGGIAVAVLGLALAYHSLRARSVSFAAMGTLAAVIGGWTIVATAVFGDTTAGWIGFSDGLAVVGLAAAGLLVHEITTERVVHSLEVEAGETLAAHP